MIMVWPNTRGRVVVHEVHLYITEAFSAWCAGFLGEKSKNERPRLHDCLYKQCNNKIFHKRVLYLTAET